MPPSSLAAALAASKTAPTKNDTQPGSSLQRRNARNTGSREKGGGKPTADKDEPTSPNQQARRQQKHNSRRNRKGKAKSPKREENEGDQSIEQNFVFLCDLSDESSDEGGSSVEKKQTPRRQKRGVRYDGKGKGQRAGRDGGRTNPIEGHDRHEWRNREGQNNQRRENRNRKGCDIGAASTPTRTAPPRTPWSNKATSERNSGPTGDRSHNVRSRASKSAGRGRADNMPSPRGQGDANTSLSLPLRNEELANVQVPFKLEAATIKGRWADEDSSDDD